MESKYHRKLSLLEDLMATVDEFMHNFMDDVTTIEMTQEIFERLEDVADLVTISHPPTEVVTNVVCTEDFLSK